MFSDFAENEFGMKAHISPSILSPEEVRFFCVFCSSSHISFDTEAVLNKHIVDAHFYAKFEKGLKKKPPFNCPFSYCRFVILCFSSEIFFRLLVSCKELANVSYYLSRWTDRSKLMVCSWQIGCILIES